MQVAGQRRRVKTTPDAQILQPELQPARGRVRPAKVEDFQGTASTAPLTLCRRNKMPGVPDSSMALTIRPLGRLTSVPRVT